MRLVSLQRWMQAVVVHPGTTEQALRSRAAALHLKPERLESVLLPSRTLTAAERIAVYQEMYPLRMRDALASDYPGLEHFLGDRFSDLVTAYTNAHPSMGYTLNRLGDRVPSFLGRQTKLRPRAFLKDLARLELAITEAFDSKEMGLLKAEDLETIRPDHLGRSRLLTVPSLRLVDLSWNAGQYLDTIRDDGHEHPSPRRAKSYVVVVRRNYSVYRFPVSLAAFLVLSDLKDGRTITSVVQRALARRGPRRASVDDFSEWFRMWTAQGVFSAVKRVAARRLPKRNLKR
jgi:Putative DNA-binding domain